MKKTLSSLLVALGLISTSAFAQVSLYGNLDQTGYRNTQNGQSVSTISSNGNSTSFWGIRGTEDLGGGLRAGFDLRSEITLGTGQVGSSTTAPSISDAQKPELFNRGAYVELASNRAGSIKVGRQIDAWFETQGLVNTSGSNSFGFGNATAIMGNRASFVNLTGVAATGLSHLGTTTQNATSVGTSNSYFSGVSYTTPTVAGFQGRIQTGNGKSTYADGIDVGNGSGYGLTYTAGPLQVVHASSWKNGTDGKKAWTNTVWGASYKMGATTLIAARNNTDFEGLAAANHNMTATSVGVNRVINAQVDANLSYTVLKDDVDSANKFTQTAATARYKLSPRTQVYAGLGYGKNQGASKASLVFGAPVGDVGQGTHTVMTGVRHTF